jgi:hypothetical protein
MSRISRVAFSPDFNFVVRKPMTYNGTDYQFGEELNKAGISERLLRKLYDQNKVDCVIPTVMIKGDDGAGDGDDEPKAVTPAPKKGKKKKAEPAEGDTPAPAADAPAEGEKPASDEAAAADTPSEPATYEVVPNFGKAMVLANGKPHKEFGTPEEAEAYVASLKPAEA